jgi:hypothetical protein
MDAGLAMHALFLVQHCAYSSRKEHMREDRVLVHVKSNANEAAREKGACSGWNRSCDT